VGFIIIKEHWQGKTINIGTIWREVVVWAFFFFFCFEKIGILSHIVSSNQRE
jgi:hypothetical protein